MSKTSDPQELINHCGRKYSEGASIKINNEVLYIDQLDNTYKGLGSWLIQTVARVGKKRVLVLPAFAEELRGIDSGIEYLPQGVVATYRYELVEHEEFDRMWRLNYEGPDENKSQSLWLGFRTTYPETYRDVTPGVSI